MLRLIVAITLIAAPILAPSASAGPEVLVVELTDDRFGVALPARVEPTAEADPGIEEGDRVLVLRAGRNEVWVPTYTIAPHASADPGIAWEERSLPGARVATYSPVIVTVAHVENDTVTPAPLAPGGYGVRVAVDTDLDGEHETVATFSPVCRCSVLRVGPYEAMWGHIYDGLPDLAFGPVDGEVP